MLFSVEKLQFNRVAVLFFTVCLVLLPSSLPAQTRKSSAKNNSAVQKDSAKKDSREDKDFKEAKPSKAELARQNEAKRQNEIRQQALRDAENERRQIALEAQRRRAQAAAESRSRARAFEQGLRAETIENILHDKTDGEDLEVRRAAVSALAGHAGTIVVMEPQTGKILTIVNQEWAIKRGFKPCSTIKLVTGVGGLNEGLIDSDGSIRNRPFPINLNDALAHSNNIYFQKVGAGLGNAKMIFYARSLGFGELTGINADGETAGKLPFGNNNARIYSHGDDFEVSPLQLAVAVSAISNGGKIVVPQIPRASFSKTDFRGYLRRQMNLPPAALQEMLPGMMGAVNYGTARRSGAADFSAAGKTGSCIGQGSWLGLFASVAPAVNPQIAVVVITRGQGERGKYAASIAGKVYRAIGYRFGKGGRDLTAKIPLQLKPQPKVNAKTSAQIDEKEGEDSDDNEVAATAKPEIKSIAKTQPAPQSLIRKTADSKPVNTAALFQPIVIQINRRPTRPRLVP